MIYLDNASTTKISPEVLEAMMPYLTEEYGNAGALYGIGRNAKSAVDEARSTVADFLGCDFDQVIFTSGGTESNNMVFKSLVNHLKNMGKNHMAVSEIEHDSVIKAAKYASIKHGFDLDFIKPDKDGTIPLCNVETMINDATGLLSVMYMNNEVGSENDIEGMQKLCSKKGILLHTDCVQASGCCELKLKEIGCDFASISSHKIHGPKGVGCLYIKNKLIVDPMICGGSEQEFGYRGGTENVAGIVGFAKACSIMKKNIRDIDAHTSVLKQLFYNNLKIELEKNNMADTIHVNGDIMKHGKIINIMFSGLDAQTLVLMLDMYGVCASAGSACCAHESQPSHVLVSMGLTPEEARSSVRFSFSKYNTIDEVVEAAGVVAKCVNVIRHM